MGSNRKSLMGGVAVLAILAIVPDLGLARSGSDLIAQAPAQAPAAASKTFSKEELDQMLRPVHERIVDRLPHARVGATWVGGVESGRTGAVV